MQYVKCFVGFCLVPESDESSNDVSDESSDEYEDKESDKISIYFRAVWTRSCSFACSIAVLQLVDNQELVATYSYKRPFQLVSFIIMLLLLLS